MKLGQSHPTLPAKDIERAKSWYADKLGLKPQYESPGGSYYQLEDGTEFLLYPSEFAGTNKATAASFEVEDVPAAVKELKGNGVEFQEYDFPGLKTVDGVAEIEGIGKAAWFTDSEGNIVALGDPTFRKAQS